MDGVFFVAKVSKMNKLEGHQIAASQGIGKFRGSYKKDTRQHFTLSLSSSDQYPIVYRRFTNVTKSCMEEPVDRITRNLI